MKLAVVFCLAPTLVNAASHPSPRAAPMKTSYIAWMLATNMGLAAASNSPRDFSRETALENSPRDFSRETALENSGTSRRNTGYRWVPPVKLEFRGNTHCFHGKTEFLGGDGSPIAVSKLKVGDTMMVMEESNRANPALGVPTKATILGWTRRPLPEGATTASDECSARKNSFVEITYSCGTDCTGAMSVTTKHYIRVNAGARSVLKLARELSEGEEIEVWSANANSIVAGKITRVRNFEDDVTAIYSPITDKGTNFVVASGAVVPMAGETVIDGVVVNHNYITMLHNLLLTIKQLAPAALWDTAFAPALAVEPSILEGCLGSSAVINNIIRALRANNNEGLSLVARGGNHADLGNSAEVMQWAASNIFKIVGVQDTGAWSVHSAVTATAGLALEAASQLAFKISTGTTVKIDVSKDTTQASPTHHAATPTGTPKDAAAAGGSTTMNIVVIVIVIIAVLFVFGVYWRKKKEDTSVTPEDNSVTLASNPPWSAQDDAALQNSYAASLEDKELGKNERWKQVSKIVGNGHGKKDCHARHTLLKGHMQTQQEGELK